MGLDIYLIWDDQTEDDRTAQYRADTPELYAQTGYLRSSYNDGGFNSWAERSKVPNLYSIFGVEGDHEGPGWKEEYSAKYEETVTRFHPDWQASRARAMAAIDTAERVPPFGILRAHGCIDAFSTEEVLPAFLKHYEQWTKRSDDWAGYSNREGVFYVTDQPKVYAVMWENRGWGKPEPVLIIDADHAWYKNFLVGVVGFIDLALTKQNPRLMWSG